MAYSSPFLRVVMSGETYPGEGFSCGLTIGQNFDGPVTQPSDLTPYQLACAAWFARPGSKISTKAKLTLLKVNLVGVDGKYASNDSTAFHEYLTPVTGGNSAGATARVAPQLTLAVTLTTARKRGLAARGRLYPPMPIIGIEDDGLITVADAQLVGDSMATLINDLNSIGTGDVSVMSEVGTGAVGRVTGVEVGRVIDTQRRRRRSLTEARVPALTAVASPPA